MAKNLIQKEVIYKDKSYSIKVYIERDNIIFLLESDSNKYSKNYRLEDLYNLSNYFKMGGNLEEELKYIEKLFELQLIIEEKEKEEKIILTFKNILLDEIKIILNKKDDTIDISYNSLSENMKEIIKQNKLILGIDLGTTYSCASVMIDEKIIIIRNSIGLTRTPSYISFLSMKKVYVGELAKLLPSNEKNVIFNIKRLLGKKYEEKEIKEMTTNLSFKLKADNELNSLKIILNFTNTQEEKKEEEFFPEQICALILQKIIKDSEFYLSKKIGTNIIIKNCVITVPAYFNQKQRESTMNSAKILGLEVKTMINEPTAASLAYFYQSLENANKKIIVIDLGGGTLDITLLRYRKDNEEIYFDVIFTYGNTHFGGEDFDNKLMKKCNEKCKNSFENGLNSLFNKDKNIPYNLRLKRACERAKIKLSSFKSTDIHIENYLEYKSIDFHITQEDFNNFCKDLFDKFRKILDAFIADSKMTKEEISKSEVILIGGSILIPRIKSIIKEKFEGSIIKEDLDPKEVVARGAAIRGAKINNLPAVKDIKLFDVTNLSLGIRKKGNILAKLVNRSAKIPSYNNKDIFYTTENNQTEALVELYEGESINDCDKKNLLLGKFIISGLPKREAGKASIEINLNVEDNSIYEVTAQDLSNELNHKTLKIEKQTDFLKIIDKIKERTNHFIHVENNEYNKIKFSIINSEEEIRKNKNKKKIDYESIQEEQKKILIIIGDFLKNYQYNGYLNIYISFIKYYFNKVCEFFQEYKQKNEKDKNVKEVEKEKDNNFLKIIKENIRVIFEELQIHNANIIYEIIEEFIDLDNIYKSFIDFLLKSYYEEILTIFYFTKSVKNENNRDKLKEGLNDLSKAEKLADICINIINKFKKYGDEFNTINKENFDNIKWKIKGRKKILEIKDKICVESVVDKNDLHNFYNEYQNSPYIEVDDLLDIEKLIHTNEIKISQNFDQNWEKAQNFIKFLKNESNRNNILNTIYEILKNYPYSKVINERNEMMQKFNDYKSEKIPKYKFLDFIKGKYQDVINEIRSKQNTETESLIDLDLDVFNNILSYLNKCA